MNALDSTAARPITADHLRTALRAVGLSQTELARLMGVTRGAVANWLRPGGTAPAGRVAQLHELLDPALAWAQSAEREFGLLPSGYAEYLEQRAGESGTETRAELLRLGRAMDPRAIRAALAVAASQQLTDELLLRLDGSVDGTAEEG